MAPAAGKRVALEQFRWRCGALWGEASHTTNLGKSLTAASGIKQGMRLSTDSAGGVAVPERREMSNGGDPNGGDLGSPQSPKRARETFDAAASSASAARRFVRRIAEQSEASEVVRQAELLVSELVTNAIQHAREPVEVGVDMDGRLLRVEVYDNGEGLPRVEPESVWSDHGRGLRLVAAISDRWGVRPDRDRMCVWFELQHAPLTT